MKPELLSLSYSPWSERARWALDARSVSYEKKHFQPLLGEPALRFRTKRFTGTVSVPVLFTDNAFYTDSLEIAKWANTQGSGPDLFPEAHRTEIEELHRLSEAALSAGRSLALRRVLGDPEALRELVPPYLRKLGGVALAIARSGVKRTLAKYGAASHRNEDQREVLRGALLSLRSALGKSVSSSPRTLLPSFSFADITASQALSFVVPPTHAAYRIGSASRRSFEDPDFMTEFADLVTWRDDLYSALRTK